MPVLPRAAAKLAAHSISQLGCSVDHSGRGRQAVALGSFRPRHWSHVSRNRDGAAIPQELGMLSFCSLWTWEILWQKRHTGIPRPVSGERYRTLASLGNLFLGERQDGDASTARRTSPIVLCKILIIRILHASQQSRGKEKVNLYQGTQVLPTAVRSLHRPGSVWTVAYGSREQSSSEPRRPRGTKTE